MLCVVIVLYFRIGIDILRKKREHGISIIQKIFGTYFVLVGITNSFALIAYESYYYENLFAWMTRVAIVLCVLSGFFISYTLFIITYGENVLRKYHGQTIWIIFCSGITTLVFILSLNGSIMIDPLHFGVCNYSSFFGRVLLTIFGSMLLFILVFGVKMLIVTDKKARMPIMHLTLALGLLIFTYIMDICMRSSLISFDFLIITFSLSIVAVLWLKKVFHIKRNEQK
jgi:hypothetical protein